MERYVFSTALNSARRFTAGVAEKVPAEVRDIAGAKLMGTSDPARQDAMLALAKTIFK